MSNILTPGFGDQPPKNLDAIKSAFTAQQRPANPDRPLLVETDAQGRIKPSAATAPQSVNLVPFEDGVLFRYSANKAKPGTVLIHDAAGQVVALAMNEQIGDIITKGCHLFFMDAQAHIKEMQAKEAAEKNQLPLPLDVQVAAAAKVVETLATDIATAKPYCEELDSPSPEAGK